MATKSSAKSAKSVAPLSDVDVDAFLVELYETRKLRDDLELANHGGLPTQIIARATALSRVRSDLAELENRYLALRGDFDIAASPTASTVITPIDWRMQIQAEAWEHWIRLRAMGCNPSVHSICDDMAKWCIAHNVRGDLNQNPRSGTIRNAVLAAGHWTPPQHSVEQAKAHVARVAQVAQPHSVPNNTGCANGP